MSPSLDDIPFEVVLYYLLPLLSIKEVGALAMVSTIWWNICNDNEIWKNLYLRTIRARIEDTSVHLGPRWGRRRDITSERLLFEQTHKIPDPIYIEYQPLDLHLSIAKFYYQSLNSRSLLNLARLSCIPIELRLSLKSYRDIRKDGIDSDELTTTAWPHRLNIAYCSEYSEYIRDEWIKYNAERDLSTVNLCQCQDHYTFETLGIPGGCRNYKSFKKVTLRKQLTLNKHETKKYQKQVDKAQKDLKRAMKFMAATQSKLDSATRNLNSNESLCSCLTHAIEDTN
jgi:hypothetical protein